MQTKETFMAHPEITDQEVKSALNHAIEQVKRQVPEFYDEFPAAASKDNFYPKIENVDWTNGFWTGEIWLAYEETKDEKLKEAALHQVSNFKNRIEKKDRRRASRYGIFVFSFLRGCL